MVHPVQKIIITYLHAISLCVIIVVMDRLKKYP